MLTWTEQSDHFLYSDTSLVLPGRAPWLVANDSLVAGVYLSATRGAWAAGAWVLR